MEPSSLNAARRARDLERLAAGDVVDLLVFGGGVTGTGIALDAATRGLSVALLEEHDLAHGTSRWSSKLVHGGLRYLARGQVGVAWESAVERGRVMERIAPHLVRPLAMLAPVGPALRPRRAALVAAGFAAGDALRRSAGTRSATLPPPRWVGPAAARALAPALREPVQGGVVCYDGQLADDVRLVVALARTAAAFGARIVTRCRVDAADGTGAEAVDVRTGARVAVRARAVVNATGVWADRLADDVALRPSKGAHLVLGGARLGGLRGALTVPMAGSVNRFAFALPQQDGRVYVGITDDPVDELEDEPRADADDVAFLLGAIAPALEDPPRAEDVLGTYAGYRPLLARGDGATADLSRSHAVHRSPDGLVTVVGGKLTTYRCMAEDAVDRAVGDAGLSSARPCRTAHQPLVGALPRRSLAEVRAPAWLVGRYGGEAPAVAALVDADPGLARPVVEGLPYLRAELRWALEHEGAVTVDDLLDRRTRIGLVPTDRARALPVAQAAIEVSGAGPSLTA